MTTVPLRWIRKCERVAVLDVETTGLNPAIADVLQLAIVDQDGNVVLNSFYDSKFESWPEAEAVNGITKGMVRGFPMLRDEADEVSGILSGFDAIVGYNVGFDLKCLLAAGVRIPQGTAIVDLMDDFSQYRNVRELKRWKLSEAASWADHDMMKAHDAVYDSLAALAVLRKLQEESS